MQRFFFGSFDENLKKQGIVGLSNASKLDGEIFQEFKDNWDKLAYESEVLIEKYCDNISNYDTGKIFIPLGNETKSLKKQRINQDFFRAAILASYNNSCCITGLSNKDLLIASHIKPWKDSDNNEKTNPQNGLCLNALHDKAFDRGFITIKPDYSIVVSDSLSDICSGDSVEIYFRRFENKKIRLPDKFMPDKLFLEYHNDVIFENWK